MNGVLNIYKEAGFTSHDVVAKLRGILKQKKIGHTGTLDPDAEGVLPVCLGNATKLCGLLSDKEKTYEAVLLLGQTTDTQDVSGKVLSASPVDVEEEAVRKAVMSFLGDYDQIPPMYSALKVGGKKLYELAREGKEVERKARRVRILDIQIHWIRLPEVSFSVTCSSGTYIRTLCADIGEILGCGGCMKHLLRTRVDRFEVGESLRLGEVENLMKEGKIGEALLPVEEVFASYPKLYMKKEGDRLVHNGNLFFREDTDESRCQTGGDSPDQEKEGEAGKKGQVRVFDSSGCFVGIYRRQTEQGRESYRPVKMFLS